MGSTNEMFERGRQDAEQDDLNPFYYQHYYHYRRGYDQARRRLNRTSATGSPRALFSRSTALLGLFALLLVGGIIFWSRLEGGNSQRTASLQTAEASTPAASVASPTRRSRTPTPAPVTPTQPLILRIDGGATIINLNGNPLRVRAGAGTKQPVIARLPEGTEIKLLEGPVEADGYSWWRVDVDGASGWLAERSLEGVVWLQPK